MRLDGDYENPEKRDEPPPLHGETSATQFRWRSASPWERLRLAWVSL